MTLAILLFGLALAVSLIGFPALIGQLAKGGWGQRVREEGPSAHLGKAGTPTAGGLLFLALAAVLYVLADRSPAGGLVLLALLLGGALGLADDLRAILARRNLGLLARQKIIVQLAIGLLLSYLAWRWGFSDQRIPLNGVSTLDTWLIPIGAIAFAAGSNAFNLTDGSDGLAAGVGAIAFGALAFLAIRAHQPAGGYVSAVLAGALCGFLFYNVFPARVFMGDTGSLALGTAMVGAALVNGLLWFLPLLAIIFVLETLSVIAQVASFKITGKRIFRMSPLHNHFELGGWSENRVAAWFWAVGAVAALITVVLVPTGRS